MFTFLEPAAISSIGSSSSSRIATVRTERQLGRDEVIKEQNRWPPELVEYTTLPDDDASDEECDEEAASEISPYRGKVTCVPENLYVPFDTGVAPAYVVSPNAGYVPLFQPWVPELQARADGRYGLEDFTQHPQLLHPSFHFLACVPRRPIKQKTPDDPFGPFFYCTLKADDLHKHDGPLDVTQPRVPFLKKLKEAKDDIEETVVKYQKRVKGLLAENENNPLFFTDTRPLRFLLFYLRMTYVRLGGWRQSFYQAVRLFSDFQKSALGIRAFTEFEVLRHDVLFAIEDTPFPQANERFMGLFVMDLNAVERYTRMGLPVWHIRRFHDIQAHHIIGLQVKWTLPLDVVTAQSSPPYPSLGAGFRNPDMVVRTFECSQVNDDATTLSKPETLVFHSHLDASGRTLSDIRLHSRNSTEWRQYVPPPPRRVGVEWAAYEDLPPKNQAQPPPSATPQSRPEFDFSGDGDGELGPVLPAAFGVRSDSPPPPPFGSYETLPRPDDAWGGAQHMAQGDLFVPSDSEVPQPPASDVRAAPSSSGVGPVRKERASKGKHPCKSLVSQRDTACINLASP